MAKASCSFGPIMSAVLSSPIGDLTVACCSKAVHSLQRMSEEMTNLNSVQPDPNVQIEIKYWLSSDEPCTYPVVQQCVQWLRNYFHPSVNKFNDSAPMPAVCHLTSIDINSSTFTTRVWETLRTAVPTGQTLSYGQLAVLSGGTEKMSRAVGQAMRTNPVILLVPCHRVLLSSGKIGNFSAGGPSIKEFLLDHEQSYKKCLEQ